MDKVGGMIEVFFWIVGIIEDMFSILQQEIDVKLLVWNTS